MGNPILTDRAPHAFYDSINTKKYDQLRTIAVAAAAANIDLISCLAPVCGTRDSVFEKRKGEYVQYLLNLVTVSGADVTTLLTAESPCSCVDYACACEPEVAQAPATE